MIVIKRTHQVGYYGVDQYGRYWATIKCEGQPETCSLCHAKMTSGYVCGEVYACDKCAKMELGRGR